ncbi:50S ribosomal protein L29 [Phaeocystidibacter luteus]|uniref:Large ribosomal subunit protein uL29 n=1 Tax=Phaeocystidibacter luteus TaxID=911197 RepID=A0A6N6REF9_9FLAO|nr:50S ribosomal protein L29 [Phaeocystidibacter luteus]KAB2808127.1 50S ribosomal protein L29 [Phaeocystidibacter luteus]
MKQSEITGLTTEELQEQLVEFEQNLTKMRMTHHISPLENPMSLRATRRDVARIKTELAKRNSQASEAKA